MSTSAKVHKGKPKRPRRRVARAVGSWRLLQVPLLLSGVGVAAFVLASAWVGAPGPPPAAGAPSTPPVSAPAPPPSEAAHPDFADRRGVYLTANVAGDPDQLERLIARSLAAGFNAIVIDVKDNGGTLAFPSKVPLAGEIGAVLPRFDLPALAAHVRARGLYFIARQVVFSDPKLAAHLGVRGDEWVLPSNETAIAYNLAVAEEVAAAGVDEIQFDYIRYPDEGSIGGSYPERGAAVERFLARAQARVGKQVHLSADVFGRTLWDWNPKDIDPIGQVLERLSAHVDVLSPMIYPSHYEPYFHTRPHEVVLRGMTVGRSRGLPLRPFLQAFDWRVPEGMSLPAYIRAQLAALGELGSDAYLFWNPRSDYAALWTALGVR